MTSVSVWLSNTKPAACSSARSSSWFSMMPLCTSAMRGSSLPTAEKCGWALWVAGAPWVAQRVWAMPVKPPRPSLAAWSDSSATRWVLRVRRSCPSMYRATPQES